MPGGSGPPGTPSQGSMPRFGGRILTSFLERGEVCFSAVSDGREQPATRRVCLNGREAEGVARGVESAAARVGNGPDDPTARRPAAEVGRPPGGDPDESTLRSPDGRVDDPASGMAAFGSRDNPVVDVSPA